MNYLSIGNPTDKISYAIFENSKLRAYGDYQFKSTDEINKAMELERSIMGLILNYKIDFVLVKWLDYLRLKRSLALDLVSFRSIIRLACGKTNTIYLEVDNYGWSKYLLEKNKSKYKVDVINKAYDLNLKNDINLMKGNQETIADCIMLGEAMAHNRITSKPRQPIVYKWQNDFRD